MKCITFIVGNYYPTYSAVGLCANNVIKILKHTYRIKVVCFKQNIDELDYEVVDNVEIYRTSSYLDNLRLKADSNCFANGNLLVNTSIKNSNRAIRYLNAFQFKSNTKRDVINSFYSCLETIHQKVKIEAIIPCCFPFESVLAAIKFKETNPTTKVYPYLFDNFPESNTLHRVDLNKKLKIKMHYKLLFTLLDKADAVLAMNSFKGKLNIVNSPIHYIEHPLLSKPEIDRKIINNHSELIELTFAGSLNKGVREPFYLIEIFKELIKAEKDIRLNLYVMGEFIEYLRNQSLATNGKIYLFEAVPYNEILPVLEASNILINISDNKGIQISSKVFTYMALGKPILNLYQNLNDNTMKILEKYPLALSIRTDRDIPCLSKIIDFIKTNCKSNYPFSKLKKIYPDALPEFTAEILKKII